MAYLKGFLVFIIAAVATVSSQETTANDPIYVRERRLLNKLVDAIDATFPPHNMTVTVNMHLNKVVEANMRKGKVTVEGWLSETWTDERVREVASRLDFYEEGDEAIESFRSPLKNFFIPDIVIFNGQSRPILPQGDMRVLVTPKTGQLLLFIPQRWEVDCNILSWPAQNIEMGMKFGSWVYPVHRIDLDVVPITHIPDDNENSECVITGKSSEKKVETYACCPEGYSNAYFRYNMSCGQPRGTRAQMQKLTADEKLMELSESFFDFSSVPTPPPTMISPFLILVIFLLPPTSGERIIFSSVIFVSLLLQMNFTFLPERDMKFLTFGCLLCVAATFFSLLPIVMLPRDDLKYDVMGKGKKKFRLARLFDFVFFAVFAAILVIGIIASTAF